MHVRVGSRAPASVCVYVLRVCIMVGEGEEGGGGRLKRGKGRKLGTKRGNSEIKGFKIDFRLSTMRQRGMVRG